MCADRINTLFSLSAPSLKADLLGLHHGIHNFTFGTLETYFGLSTSPGIVFDKGILFISRPRAKTWVFDSSPDLDRLRVLQRQGPVYSQQRLDLPKAGKFSELAYDLDVVFDPNSYPNKKKRAQRIKYPKSWMGTHQVEIRSMVQLVDVDRLHTRWKEWKLAQPETYRMMFPSRRYYSCVEFALNDPDYVIFAAYSNDDQLQAVRVLYVEGTQAFDLAQFGAFWEMPSNFSEYFASVTMLLLHDRGIKYLNCGASLNSHLSTFKSHWPHFKVESWMYGRTV